MSTKQQEREALKKILEIVGALGPDSYIAAAFEGCFDDAEANIENDWALSMKDRWLAADRKLNEANGTIEELQGKLAKSEQDYEADHATAIQLIEEKNAVIASLKAQVLSEDDLTDCLQMARDFAYGYQEKMEEAAASVVELADDPTSPEFSKAVRDHRNAKSAYEYGKALASRLEKIRDNMTAGEQ